MYKYGLIFCSCLLFSLSSLAQDADPTRPPLNTPQQQVERIQAPGLTLVSIWYQPGNSRVRINEESYRLGDTVDGYRIIGIEANEVRLEKDGRQLVLSVFGSQRIINREQNP